MKYVLVIGVLLLVVGCTTVTDVPVEKQCTIAEDCVPDVCCHAADAVNKEYGPECAAILCSQDCQPGTLDCGQGTIECINSKCTAVIE